MKRYMSIDHIYIEKIADTVKDWCDWDEENEWLKTANELHSNGHSWKAIYFAMAEVITARYRKKDNSKDFSFVFHPCFPLGGDYAKLLDIIDKVEKNQQCYTCAEEFGYRAFGGK